jgi:hypothetical protein
VPFQLPVPPRPATWDSDLMKYAPESAEERLVKMKGLSPGPKKWYGERGPHNLTDAPQSKTPYEFPRTMEGLRSNETGESDFKRRSRQHERNSGRAPVIPDEGSSCTTDPSEVAGPPRDDHNPVKQTGPDWEDHVAAAVQAFESYKLLMGITVTTLEGQLTKHLRNNETNTNRREILEALRDDMSDFVSNDLLRRNPVREQRGSANPIGTTRGVMR